MTSDLTTRTFSMLGAGRVATALTLALSEMGWKVAQIVSRTRASAETLSKLVPGTAFCSFDELTELPESVVIISVKDDSIHEVAELLVGLRENWSKWTVIHTSGTWPSSILKPLEDAGAKTASFHPVQTFADHDGSASRASLFTDLPIAIEGHPSAVDIGYAIAEQLEAKPFILTPESKGLFHVAAVMSSNYIVTLLSMAEEISAKATNEQTAAGKYFSTLAAQAVQNATELDTRGALTGPIARGDVRVFESHLLQLTDKAAHLVPIYAAMAVETIRLAQKSDTISHETAEHMLSILSSCLASHNEKAQSPGSER